MQYALSSATLALCSARVVAYFVSPVIGLTATKKNHGPSAGFAAASIEAAANPADGPWFFFVAVNPITGETKYATTLAEHNANVAELNAYCDAKPQDCGQ